MESIHFILKILAGLFICLVLTKIWMNIANCIGKQLGFSKFIIALWNKIRGK